MQGFAKRLADVPGIPAGDRPENYTLLVVEDSSPPAWTAWFMYNSAFVPASNDNFYWIVPLDGVGAWKRINSSQDTPPQVPAG